MTPEQLERIKAYIGKVRYDETQRELLSDNFVIPILDTAVGKFIEQAINEKLGRDDKIRQAIKLARLHEPTYPAMFKHTPNDIIRQVFPPIELKNLKDPE
jgi:hypothetical protein